MAKLNCFVNSRETQPIECGPLLPTSRLVTRKWRNKRAPVQCKTVPRPLRAICYALPMPVHYATHATWRVNENRRVSSRLTCKRACDRTIKGEFGYVVVNILLSNDNDDDEIQLALQFETGRLLHLMANKRCSLQRTYDMTAILASRSDRLCSNQSASDSLQSGLSYETRPESRLL